MPHRLSFPLLILACLLALLAGCSSLGPGSVGRDRFDYNTALNESWKRQILLNVVKIRYVEPLFFVDVGQIVAGYSLETGVSAGFSRQMFDFDANHANVGKLDLGATAKYTDRPTITYTPMTGTPFLKGVMSPMPPLNVLMSIQSGVSADFLCKLGVGSINGIRNETIGAAGYRPPDPQYAKVVALLSELQQAGAIRVQAEGADPNTPARGRVRVAFGGRGLPADVLAKAGELKALLGLDPAVELYDVVQAPTADTPRQFALQTHSLMHILAAVAVRVEIPEEDIRAGRAIPGVRESVGALTPQGLAVKSSATKPADAFVSVFYRGRWFYVEDGNLPTKRVFSFIMLAFTLLDGGKRDSTLQLTLPAQ
ncbi:hypothetical protein JCM15519_31190 [Fundidesulfovibrio butyratiphilus]